jgi:hypothetical protein
VVKKSSLAGWLAFRFLKLLLACPILIIVEGEPVVAETTYYVDCTLGNDANDGLPLTQGRISISVK